MTTSAERDGATEWGDARFTHKGVMPEWEITASDIKPDGEYPEPLHRLFGLGIEHLRIIPNDHDETGAWQLVAEQRLSASVLVNDEVRPWLSLSTTAAGWRGVEVWFDYQLAIESEKIDPASIDDALWTALDDLCRMLEADSSPVSA